MINWTIDTMVSMSLLMALVLIIRKPVSNFFGAHIAYLLWALPLARLFMPTLTLQAPPPVDVGEAAATATTPLLSEIAMISPGQTDAVSALASIDWAMIALVIWIGGAGLLFISKLAAYFQFREDIVSDGQLVGRHGRIKILETAAVSGPLAFGIFEKYIAVPTNFSRDYAPRERELALEHEISHHESGDLAANFVGLLVLSLHWFNPVAWYAWIAFRQDQETACDARVLQNSGRELRAIYGRTIAKSVSGHQLGLASPLNQKNKIKDRLKMLGQKEKSTFRKRVGALMVGASTVVALPLTATVTYAEEVSATPQESAMAVDSDNVTGAAGYQQNNHHNSEGGSSIIVAVKNADGYKYKIDNNGRSFEFQSPRKLKNEQISEKLREMGGSGQNINIPVAPIPPVPPVPPVAPEPLNITMLNGEKNWAQVRASGNEYVHKIQHNGRTVILRTNKQLSKDQVRSMVEKAEKSRREADEVLRETKFHGRDAHAALAEAAQELKQAEREWKQKNKELSHLDRHTRSEVERALQEARQEVREAQQEAAQAIRDAEQDAREAQREAIEAAREAQQEAREGKSVAARVWGVSQIVFKPISKSVASSVNESSGRNISRNSNAARNRNANCVVMNRGIAFAGQGTMKDRTLAVVAGCGAFEVKIDEQAILKVAREGLEQARAEAAKCDSKDVQHDGKIKAKNQLSMT
ncbi:MAG: M56 family metallopeptidase [Parasphingorhabdus sp.]|uniref:M56 family metallopeptidase n=1 Tax=Parasphingorhabdus sp. TaxID=2709688 RepID=UPI0030017CC1